MMTEKIKIALIKRGMTSTQLAKDTNTSTSNLYHKFKRDNFSVKELLEIAEALNCTLEINFIDNNTKEAL